MLVTRNYSHTNDGNITVKLVSDNILHYELVDAGYVKYLTCTDSNGNNDLRILLDGRLNSESINDKTELNAPIGTKLISVIITSDSGKILDKLTIGLNYPSSDYRELLKSNENTEQSDIPDEEHQSEIINNSDDAIEKSDMDEPEII